MSQKGVIGTLRGMPIYASDYLPNGYDCFVVIPQCKFCGKLLDDTGMATSPVSTLRLYLPQISQEDTVQQCPEPANPFKTCAPTIQLFVFTDLQRELGNDVKTD